MKYLRIHRYQATLWSRNFKARLLFHKFLDIQVYRFYYFVPYGMEMNVEKTKVMRTSRQPSPVTITIDQKQLENVRCFKYLGSLLTDDGRCTCEIKSRIAMAKAAFNKKKNLFTSKLDLNLRKKLVEHGSVWC